MITLKQKINIWNYWKWLNISYCKTICKVLPISIIWRMNCRHSHGSQRHAKHESSSKSNSLHIELSFPIHVVNVPALYYRTAGATRYFGKTFSPRWIVNDTALRGLIRVQLFLFVPFARTADVSIMFAISKWLRLPQSRDRVFFPRHRWPDITGFFNDSSAESMARVVSSRVSLANSMMAPTVSVIDLEISLYFSISPNTKKRWSYREIKYCAVLQRSVFHTAIIGFR